MHVANHESNWLWLDVYFNWLSYKTCILFTSLDVIYYCLQIIMCWFYSYALIVSEF